MNKRLFMFAMKFCSYFVDFIVALSTDELGRVISQDNPLFRSDSADFVKGFSF